MDHDDARPGISRIGDPRVVYSNRHGALADDDVRGPRGDIGRYLRFSWANGGVVTVPFDGRQFHLWEMYRYPIGDYSWEFPRGAADPDEPIEKTAARELAEETGMEAQELTRMGDIYADTGLIAQPCAVVLAWLSPGAEAKPRRPEPFEAVAGTLALTIDELTDHLRAGKIRCGLTIAAFHLARLHLEERNG
ncbi:ADP-ribose pyrophosphatase [Actinoplanes tereljensis]|uniref:ADP-ribose pyrophosphatase n=1 Tax=Paractinoplanes tereljensis TaxID=571912 RepID=A0A919TTC5_9ACTN|nr:NUDIX hydrolase [Actinoplanes tereljensis]GIF20240.1 ADP-ribose pyrophosphatase [Actinoplanes tereljensis]